MTKEKIKYFEISDKGESLCVNTTLSTSIYSSKKLEQIFHLGT
jgi:hypothetical protein